MNNQPQTSVIIPTYNRPHLIGRAIKSVLVQTYQDFEIIVIDSSPDNKTEQAVKDFNNERIKYVHNKARTNASVGRNQGIKESGPSSKYVAFLDDDDEFFPEFLEKTVRILENKDDVCMATSNLEIRTRDGKKVRGSCGATDSWEQGVGCGCLVRKDIFTKENFWYDERLEIMEVPDLGVRVLTSHKWERVPEILWAYYVYPNSNELTLCSAPSLESAELFYHKNYSIFERLGRKALAFLNFRQGKLFLRAGKIKKGKKYVLKSLLLYPSPVYLLHYFLSLVDLIFPGFSKNNRLRIIKQKIFRGKI